MSAAERETRLASAESGRRALRASGGWDEAFKGRRPNAGKMEGKYAEVISLLSAGVSIRKTADISDVSISTVQRIKSKYL